MKSRKISLSHKTPLSRRIFSALIVVTLTLAATGCQCSKCRSNNWFNPLSGFGSQRIAPPATYSYQPPNGQNNPYYNPNSTATLPNGLPANTNPNANPNWQPTNKSSATSTATNPYAYSPPAGYPTNIATLANNTTNVRSTDFRTTTVDERNDPTRMPVTDATVQPRRFHPSQLAQNQPIYIQGQYQYQAQPRLYSVPNGVLANASTAVNPSYQPNYANTGYYYNNGQANGWQPTGQINR